MFGPQASPVQAWAVSHDSVQITWGALPEGPVTVTCGPAVTTVEHQGGPGSATASGLDPATAHDVTVTTADGVVRLSETVTTAARPPGNLLARLATVSDLHIGARRWGAFKTMTEVDPAPEPDISRIEPADIRAMALAADPAPEPGRPPGPWTLPHPWRSAVSAIDDAERWGAELLVLKGDIAQHETAHCFAQVDTLVDAFPGLPMVAIPGNHDVDRGGTLLPRSLGRRLVPLVHDVTSTDLDGLRVIAANTAVPNSGRGSIASVADAVIDLVTSSDRPVLLLIHQQLQPTRVARHWPIGIPAPESTHFLDRLDHASQPVFVSSGHTHRNRVRRHGSVTLTEVASTKDWPGVWAGYEVFEGGIVQTVRRISHPSVMAWHEYSRRAVAGLWARWSPGQIEDRCVTRLWSD